MPLVKLVEDEIWAETAWHEKDQIKSVPGARWHDTEKVWALPATWTSCVQLRGVFGKNLTLDPSLREWAQMERSLRIDPAMGLRDRTEADDWPNSNPKLYPFQQAGVRFLSLTGRAILADEMGTGKTVQTLEMLRLGETDELGEDYTLPALVICPNSMKGTWANEAKKWLPASRPYVIRGTALQRRKLLAQAAQDPAALVIINFESVRGHSKMAGFGSINLKGCKSCKPQGYVGIKESDCEMHPRELNTIPFRTVIVDEAHRMKDPKAKQTRAIWAIGDKGTVRHRYALTGTPIANHPGDLWSLLRFMSPKEFPAKSKFVDRYCQVAFNAWGGMEITGINPEYKDEFYKILDPRFRRMPKALVLSQLPDKVPMKRHVPLDAKQLKAYQQMEDGLVTRLEDGSVMVAKSNLTAQIRLLQFSSAYMVLGEPKKVTLDDGTVEWQDTWVMSDPSPKLDALEEILEELEGKSVAVCAEHRQLIELAAKRLDKLKISYGMITGGVAQWERDIMLKQFQEGRLQVMLFTIKAGGTGLTMTAADTIVFLQRSWSMIDNKQAEDRVHRIGSEIHESIKVIDIVAEGTVEEAQIERLWEKSQRLDEITRDRIKLIAAGLSTAPLDLEEQKILNANLGTDL